MLTETQTLLKTRDNKENLERVFIKGGIMSPSELIQIIERARGMGLESIMFGSRQDILFPSTIEVPKSTAGTDDHISSSTRHQNIVCSYVSTDIFSRTTWLNGSSYLYILEQFGHDPVLKINIADPRQKLVPLYTGHLNFIASHHEDYWYLHLQLPGYPQDGYYPVLVNSNDIARLAKTTEDIYEHFDSIEVLFEEINDVIEINARTIDKPLQVTFEPFPYYEGMNKMGIDKYWLGLYWRNNHYDLDFLKAMCDLCLESKIGKVCITPWKSLVIKGIPRESKIKWEKLLGRFGINIRHSSVELNWHVPVADLEAMELKNYLVDQFNRVDISTYGLTFGIYSRRAFRFTSVVLEKVDRNLGDKAGRAFRPSYNVLYCRNFDPNERNYVYYAQDVDQMDLPTLLIELSKHYFANLGEGREEEQPQPEEEEVILYDIFECSDCLSTYDSRYGEPSRGIAKGIPFEQLETTFTCSVCDAPKSSFRKRVVEGG